MPNIDLEKGTMKAGPLWVGALIFGVPIAAVLGVFLTALASLVFPSALDSVAPLYCSGEFETVVIRSNPTPGETSWSSDTFCTQDGKTWSIGWPVLLTAGAIVAVPIWIALIWWRAARRRRLGIVTGQAFPAGERLIELERKRRALKAGDDPDPSPNVEARLSELRRLRDRGLIDAEDYARKKAAILDEL